MVDENTDRQVLDAMRQCGADLTKPAHTLHYLYFRSLEAAQVAADELRMKGYEVDVRDSPGGSLMQQTSGESQFCCVAETRAVPAEADVFATTKYMNALAERHGGEYDGWEASVEK